MWTIVFRKIIWQMQGMIGPFVCNEADANGDWIRHPHGISVALNLESFPRSFPKQKEREANKHRLHEQSLSIGCTRSEILMKPGGRAKNRTD